MSSSTIELNPPITFPAAVVTVSDSCARGERVDVSGPAVADLLEKFGFRVVAKQIVQDDSMQIQNALVHLALEVRFIVTTGGTSTTRHAAWRHELGEAVHAHRNRCGRCSARAMPPCVGKGSHGLQLAVDAWQRATGTRERPGQRHGRVGRHPG